jgi:GT2 family glycosyltransferase
LEELCAVLKEDQTRVLSSLKRLESNQRTLDAHIRAIENSLIFSFLRWLGRPLLEWKTMVGQRLLHSPFRNLYLRLWSPAQDDLYSKWVDLENVSRPPIEWFRRRATEFRRNPLFSILLAVHGPSPEWLERVVQSVLNQTYPRWGFCVCDDYSEGWVQEYFAGRIQAAPSIRFVRSSVRLGIASALNRALSLATGDYFVFLDQDVVLSPYALHYFAESLQEDPAAELVYADEDLIDGMGKRTAPCFKPDWSPDVLLSCMYLGHLVVSRAAMDRAGKLRSEFDGVQDYDLALRLTDQPAVVRHVPQVLYHCCKKQGLTAAEELTRREKHAAGRLALEDAGRRRGWHAAIEDGARSGLYRIHWRPPKQPLVSIVICSRSAKLMGRGLRALRNRTDYPHWEVVVVQHVGYRDDTMERMLSHFEVKRIRYEGPFNFSRMNNLGAEAANGEVLVFLNDDVEPLVSDWLSSLAAQAQRPDVGIVGAKLLYPHGTLQHTGIAVAIGDGSGHPGRGQFATRYWPWIDLTRDVSAVTGACLAIRMELFRQLGGFDEQFPINYNDTDLCLRARQAGYRVVYEPGAVLRHYECQTRRRGSVGFEETARWSSRWSSELARGDPFYSPHLDQFGETASLNMDE